MRISKEVHMKPWLDPGISSLSIDCVRSSAREGQLIAINIIRGVKYLFSFIKNPSNRPFLNLIYQVLLIRDTIFGPKYSAC